MIFKSSDGILLYCDSFPVKDPLGSLLLVHGLGEHSGRYDEFILECHKMQLSVFALDLRGHGRSQGIRGHFESLRELHEDLDAWIAHLVSHQEIQASLPCFLFGHSLGGLIAFTYAAHYKPEALGPKLKGLILSSPALGLRWNPLLTVEQKVAEFLPTFFRTVHVPNGIAPEWLSHDEEEVDRYKSDPLVHQWITPSAFLAIQKGMKEVSRLLVQIQLPTLFLISGADKVVNADAARTIAAKLAVAHPGKVETKIFHGFFHEAFHETKRTRPYLELKKWILKCLSTTKKNSSRKSVKEAIGKEALH